MGAAPPSTHTPCVAAALVAVARPLTSATATPALRQRGPATLSRSWPGGGLPKSLGSPMRKSSSALGCPLRSLTPSGGSGALSVDVSEVTSQCPS